MNRASLSPRNTHTSFAPPLGLVPRRTPDPLHWPAPLPAQNAGPTYGYDFSRMRVDADWGMEPSGSYLNRGYATGMTLLESNLTLLRQPDAGAAAGGGAAPAATPTFPTYADMTGNATVSTKMDSAWTETKNATTRTSRREQGFWIKYDTDSSSYTCSPTFTGPSVGPDETGAADPGTKPADSGTTYTVGLFHTHTPMTYRTGGTRDVGPSGADNRFHTSNNVVGVIYDYVESPAGSGSIPAGHPLNSAAKLYPSGPNKRA